MAAIIPSILLLVFMAVVIVSFRRWARHFIEDDNE
jgi:hypothetical protein